MGDIPNVQRSNRTMQLHRPNPRADLRSTLQAVRRKLQEALELSKLQERDALRRG